MRFRLAAALILLGLTTSACSKVDFEEADVSSRKYDCEDETLCVEQTFLETNLSPSVESKINPPLDILFVMDDSASMNTILTSVRAGFASLQSTKFPVNTRMAVTYMSPNALTSTGEIDFSTAYAPITKNTPGHLALVSGATISNFVALTPDRASYFPMAGCSAEWFAPKAVNTSGDLCLDAATQSPLYGTGVEAGVVSLDQLVAKYTIAGKRLFREGALAQVIFVSDTHEPGAQYFGKVGAPASQKSLNQLQSAIEANSTNIASIKFSGILPVPVLGDAKLDGLNVVGPIPQTLAEAIVSNENLDSAGNPLWWNYSYLPFIKGTNGVIAHPKNADWNEMASTLIEESNFTGTIFVNLQQPATTLIAVKVNGKLLDMKDVSIHESNPYKVAIRYRMHLDQNISIDVKYTTLMRK